MRIRIQTILPLAILLTLSGLTASAQLVPQATPGGVNAVLTRLFGDVNAFSAKAEAKVKGPDARPIMNTPMTFSLLDTKIRVEVNMSEIESDQIPAMAKASFKQMGMDKVVSVVRPDLKASYVIYPGLESYMEMPLSQEDVLSLSTTPKIEKKPLGNEKVGGKDCVKQQVIVTDSKGNRQVATTWNATAMRGFPIQIETSDGTNAVTILFKQVSFARPALQNFDLPPNYTKYDDPQALVRAAMQKMMGDLGGGLQGLPKSDGN